jgi:type I restriction enzyme S subunit
VNDYPELRLGDLVTPVQDRIVNRTKWHFDKYIAGEHIDSGEVRIRKCGQIKGNEEVIGSAFHMHFKPGHVLYSTRRAYLRKAGIVDFEGICSNVTLILQSNEEKLLQSLLPFILQSEDFVQFAISHSIGSTNPFVKWTDLSKYRLRIPPIRIQKKISQILWAIEDNIEKIENLIEVSEKLKKGLLEELLTKGIGHKGFKKTELGEIPEDWEVAKIADILTFEYGEGLPEDTRKGGKYPVIGSNGIVGYHTSYTVEGPTIVVGRKGASGQIIWVEDNCWPIDTSYFVKLKRELSMDYVFHLLNSLDLIELSQKGAVPGLNRKDVYEKTAAIPPFNEQKKIVSLLREAEQFTDSLKEHLVETSMLKKKLANSFLSGEFPIPEEDLS